MSDVAISTQGLGKRYRKGAATQGTLIEWLRRGQKGEYFWALKDVTFEVPRGEMLGIIGRNGAGKSTLLKILSRITRPNEGRAEVHGRVGSLLDVGTGFHPELTGQENIYLNGALIGMPRSEVHRKLDEIVDFAGIEEFMSTPLKRYSSGMKVRLGFAVAVNLQQEIMLVDEVLSVGDAAFREKCLAKMNEVTAHGRTVLFVGHNLEMVASACDRAIWLDKGRIKTEGDASDIVQIYENELTGDGTNPDGFIDLGGRAGHRNERSMTLTHVRLLDQNGGAVSCFKTGQPARLAIGYRVHPGTNPADISVGMGILARGQAAVAFCENTTVGKGFNDLPAIGEFVCDLDRLALMPGRYKLSLRCKVGSKPVCSIPDAGGFRVAKGDFYPTGILPPPGSGPTLLEHRWSLGEAKGDA